MDSPRHPVRTALLAALAFFLFSYLVQLKDSGRTYDDAAQRARGTATFSFLTRSDHKLPAHGETSADAGSGPFAVTLAAAVQELVVALHLLPPKAAVFQAFFAGILLFSALFVAVLVWLGIQLFGSTSGGLLCALLLLAMPRYWGMSCTMHGDIPAAGLCALALAAWLWVCATGAALRAVALLGLALGLLAAVRVQNALWVPVVIAAEAALRLALGQRTARRTLLRALLAVPVALAAWFAAWPDFWIAPIQGPLQVLRQLFLPDRGATGTLWFGTVVAGPSLYPLVWLMLATPTWLLVAAAFGALRTPREGRGPLPLLLAWCVVAVGKHLTGSGNYGGLRHFVDALAPLACLAALGLVRTAERWLPVGARMPLCLGLGAVAAVLGFLPSPYGDNWFSRTFGGLQAIPGRFDLDPNGTALVHALRRFGTKVEPDAVVLFVGNAGQLNQADRQGMWLADGRTLYDLLSVETARHQLAQKPLYYLHHADHDPHGLGAFATRLTLVDALAVDGVDLVVLYRGQGLPFLNDLRADLGRRLGLTR